MAYWLDSIHEKILAFLKENSGIELTLMQIGNVVWLNHSQKVLNKLEQLEKKWYIRRNLETKTYDVLDEPIRDVEYLLLYWSAQCGHAWSAILEEEPIDKIWLNTTIFWIKTPKDYILVRAEGDSMKPDIDSWDILLVHLQKDYLPGGDKVLVIHKGKPKIKQIGDSGEKKFLVSTNKDYDNLEILPENDPDIHIVWIVKKVIKDI